MKAQHVSQMGKERASKLVTRAVATDQAHHEHQTEAYTEEIIKTKLFLDVVGGIAGQAIPSPRRVASPPSSDSSPLEERCESGRLRRPRDGPDSGLVLAPTPSRFWREQDMSKDGAVRGDAFATPLPRNLSGAIYDVRAE